MKIKQFPRQEDVIEIGFGEKQVLVTPITNENKSYLIEAAFSTYLGEKCKYCGKKYKTIDDLRSTVWVGEHKHGRLACRACWSANNKAEVVITKYLISSKQTPFSEKVKFQLPKWLRQTLRS
jgi:hypothetical protein